MLQCPQQSGCSFWHFTSRGVATLRNLAAALRRKRTSTYSVAQGGGFHGDLQCRCGKGEANGRVPYDTRGIGVLWVVVGSLLGGALGFALGLSLSTAAAARAAACRSRCRGKASKCRGKQHDERAGSAAERKLGDASGLCVLSLFFEVQLLAVPKPG